MQNSFAEKILLLGSGGFVGKNVASVLEKYYPLIATGRNKAGLNGNEIWFDITVEDSWHVIKQTAPSLVINCIGYGVVKNENDTNRTFEINYYKTASFYNFLSAELPHCKLIHIGTAFEYDLSSEALTESSPLLPMSCYGISKLMASQYLLQKKLNNPFVILRPFNMYGLYESSSKIVPYLILSQKNKNMVDLSNGEQYRDYFHVGDLGYFILNLLQQYDFEKLPKCINVGSGKTTSIKDLAVALSFCLPTYDPSLWNWGAVAQRKDESNIFYNASTLAAELGFKTPAAEQNLLTTIQYYWNT